MYRHVVTILKSGSSLDSWPSESILECPRLGDYKEALHLSIEVNPIKIRGGIVSYDRDKGANLSDITFDYTLDWENNTITITNLSMSLAHSLLDTLSIEVILKFDNRNSLEYLCMSPLVKESFSKVTSTLNSQLVPNYYYKKDKVGPTSTTTTTKTSSFQISVDDFVQQGDDWEVSRLFPISTFVYEDSAYINLSSVVITSVSFYPSGVLTSYNLNWVQLDTYGNYAFYFHGLVTNQPPSQDFEVTFTFTFKYLVDNLGGLCLEHNSLTMTFDPSPSWISSISETFQTISEYQYNNYTTQFLKSGYMPSFNNRVAMLPAFNRSSTDYLMRVEGDYLVIYRDYGGGEREVYLELYKDSFRDRVVPKRIIVVIQGGGSSGREQWRTIDESYFSAGGGSGATIIAVLNTSYDWRLTVGSGGYPTDGQPIANGNASSATMLNNGYEYLIAKGGVSKNKTRGQGGEVSISVRGVGSWLLGSKAGAHGGFGRRGSNQYPSENGASNEILTYAVDEDDVDNKYGIFKFYSKAVGGSKTSYSGGGGASPFAKGGDGVDYADGQPGNLGSGGGGAYYKPDGTPIGSLGGHGGDGFIWLYY